MNPLFSYIFIALVVLLTIFFIRRWRPKSGRLVYTLVMAIIAFISSLAFGATFFFFENASLLINTHNTAVLEDIDSYAALIVTFLFAVVFDFLWVGIVFYTIGRDMTTYKIAGKRLLLYFLIPFLLLLFAVAFLLSVPDIPDSKIMMKGIYSFCGIVLLILFIGYIWKLWHRPFIDQRRRKQEKEKKSDNKKHPPFLEFMR